MAPNNSSESKSEFRVEQSHNKALESDLPPTSSELVQRALAGAGYTRLEQLAAVSEAELLVEASNAHRVAISDGPWHTIAPGAALGG